MAFAAMATAGTIGVAPIASAQDSVIEQVIVTGSRIRRSDASSISPISVLSEADMLAAGNLTLENFLQDMPSVNGGDFGQGVNNGNPGYATVSLRGLGPNRTLVLVDGKRPAAAATNGYVDLNMIPTAIVERIEVLRDGASTVYGSDAIAGVVNIITKKNFEGVDIDYGYDITGEGDGAQHNFALTFGSTFDRGNFVLSAQMTKRDDIGQGDRGFSECPLFEQGNDIVCGGSATTTPARFFPQLDDGVGAQVLDGGVSRSFDPAGDAFNYAAVSYLQTPQDVFSAYAATNYELLDSSPLGVVTASLDMNYSNRESDQLLAPIGTFWSPLVPATHPNNPFGDALCASNAQCTAPQSVAVSRRLTESGGRRFTQDVNTYRIGLGLDGQLDNGWAWDVSYNIAKWEDGRRNFGRAVRPAIEEMLDPDLCAASTTGCPGVWNPFISNSMTAEQDRFGFTAVNTKNDSTLNILQANLTGDMAVELQGGNIGWAVGFENRRESASSNPDGGASIGAIIYTPGETTAGKYEVDEFYGELVLPVLSGVPMAEVLNIEASARYTDVDFLGSSDTVFKIAAEWAPVADIRFRATYSEGFRAPNISELFLGQQQSAETYTDPCRQYGTGADATTVANCQADGLSPDFNLATFQATTLQGGNPNLQPETSESTTIGVVFQPSALENLTVSLDYFNIEIEDAVGTAPTSEVISACYASVGFSDPLCALIVGPAYPGVDETPATSAPTRRNANLQLSGILQTNANLATYSTSGMDFQVDYGFDTDLGTVSLRATGTYLEEYDYLPFAGGDVVKLASYYGGDPAYGNPAAFSEWQANYSATLNADDWGMTLGAKFMSEVDDIAASPANLVNSADAVTYWDLQGYYDWNDITFTAGVRNLTDEEPPYVTAYDDMNTLQFSYDTLGRYFYTRVQFNF